MPVTNYRGLGLPELGSYVNPLSPNYGIEWADLGVIGTSVYNFCYAGNGVVLFSDGYGRTFYHSNDYGITWRLATHDGGEISSGSCTVGPGIIIMSGKSVYRFTDWGYKYTTISTGAPMPDNIRTICYLGNGIVIEGGILDTIYRSTTYGLTWAAGANLGGDIRALVSCGSGIAIAGAGANIQRSTDYGVSWSNLGAFGAGAHVGMCYLGNGIVISVAEGGHIFRSTDYGINWTDLGAISAGNFYCIAYLTGGIVIAGDNTGHLFRSSNYGVNWTDLGALTAAPLRCMTYTENGIALIGDNAGHVWISRPVFGSNNNFVSNEQVSDKILQFGCIGAITPNATSYLAPGNGTTQTNEIKIRVPRNCIVKNLHISQRVASGLAGRTDIYTVRLNGVNKAITCTLDNALLGSDVTNFFTAVTGDSLSIGLVSNDAADTSADVTASLELIG